MSTMFTTECRCKQCQALLAKLDGYGLSMRRGDMQTVVTGGDFTVAVTCYRCRTLNIVASRRRPPAIPPAPAPAASAT